MPASNTVLIRFRSSGDKALEKAILDLAKAQALLEGKARQYNKSVRRLRLDKERLNKEFGLATKNSRLVSNSFATLRSKLLLASFAAGLFAKTVGKLTALYAEQEKAEKRLSTALGFTSQRLLEFASAQQKITTFGDEVTISAMAQAAAFTSNEQAIEQMTIVAQDMASATGKDLKTTMDLISKSIFTSTDVLRRYGIEIKKGLTGSDKFNAIMKSINEKFGGQAAGQLDTYGGAIQSLQNAFGDLGETLGKDLAEALLPIVEIFRDMAVWLSDKPIGNLTQGFTALAGAMLITKDRLIALKTASLTFMGGAKKAAGAVAFLTRGLKFFTKAGAVWIAIEGISRLFGGFSKTKKEAKDATVAIKDLQFGVDDLAGKMAAFRTKPEFEAFFKDLGIPGWIDEMEKVESTIKDQEAVIQSLNDEYVETLMTIQNYQALMGFSGKVSEKEAKAQLKLIALKTQMLLKEKDLSISNERKLELEKQLERLGQDRIVIEEKLEQLRLQNIAWQAVQIPNLEKENELLRLKNEYSGGELEMQQLLLDARLRGVIFTEDEKESIKQLINAKIQLTNVMKQESFLVNSFNQALIQGINNNFRFAESFANMVRKMAAELMAHMATFLLFNALIPGGSSMTAIQYAINQMTGGIMGGASTGGYANPGGGDFPPINVQNPGSGQFGSSPGSPGSASGAMQGISLENQNSAMQGGSGGVIINFSGNVMSDDFIENQAIPQIKEAIRRGADIGVG